MTEKIVNLAEKQEQIRDSLKQHFAIELRRQMFARNVFGSNVVRITREDFDRTQAGYAYGTDRDIFGALGYPDVLNYSHYEAWYKRDGVGTRVINAPVDATWQNPPEITEDDVEETAFEKQIKLMTKDSNIRLWHNLKRVDRMSRVGEYSILFLGFSGVEELNQEPSKNSTLAYIRPYTQGSVTISGYVKDFSNPRFGLPEEYSIQIKNVGSRNVHWSRVIHVIGDQYDSETEGTPALENVFNYMLSLLQVVGGSGEAFWRQGIPGFAFLHDEDSVLGNLDDFKEEVDAWIHQLQRYIRLQGMDVKQLNPKIASPKDTIDGLFQLISVATGIPKRILTGSEMGERASQQDRLNWGDKIEERREIHAGDNIIKPLISRLIEYGALTPPEKGPDEYEIRWPPIYSPSEKEKAETTNTRIKTISDYLQSGAETFIPPHIFMTREMGYTEQEWQGIQEEQEEQYAEEERDKGPNERSLQGEIQEEDE